MSDEAGTRSGQVAATPEGGPIDEGIPASAPGAGQVRITPEAGPLTPPTLRDHMQGPILGLDDTSQPPSPGRAPSGHGEEPGVSASAGEAQAAETFRAQQAPPEPSTTRTAHEAAELQKWPPYRGKPVSEVHWDDARRYAAPLLSQAEKLTIQAIALSGRGLSKLARYLEQRRERRE